VAVFNILFEKADSREPKEPHITWRAHWRYLANITARSVFDGDAGFTIILHEIVMIYRLIDGSNRSRIIAVAVVIVSDAL